jgi:mRNA interferase MazF
MKSLENLITGRGLFPLASAETIPDRTGHTAYVPRHQIITKIMGHYLPGDVILVSASIDNRSGAKVRPAVVVFARDNELGVCPVSSKSSLDSISIPLSIDDFASGGLDLFTESYVLVSRVLMFRNGDVIGKRGRLLTNALAEILSVAPVPGIKGKNTKK